MYSSRFNIPKANFSMINLEMLFNTVRATETRIFDLQSTQQRHPLDLVGTCAPPAGREIGLIWLYSGHREQKQPTTTQNPLFPPLSVSIPPLPSPPLPADSTLHLIALCHGPPESVRREGWLVTVLDLSKQLLGVWQEVGVAIIYTHICTLFMVVCFSTLEIACGTYVHVQASKHFGSWSRPFTICSAQLAYMTCEFINSMQLTKAHVLLTHQVTWLIPT